MNIEEIISNLLNGEPIHDSLMIGISFIFAYEFYKVFFSAVFSIFNKN